MTLDSAIVAHFPTDTQRRALARLRELLCDPLVCPRGHLPSERELAEHVGVSRPTLRLVLQGMEQAGLIRAISAKKRVATLPAAPPSTSDLTVAVLWHVEEPGVPSRQPAPGWSHQTRFGITQALQSRGENVLLLHPQSFVGKPPEWLRDAGFLGLIVDGDTLENETTRKMVLGVRSSGVAVVVHGDEPWMQPLDRVVSDHREGSYALTRALISSGRRNILRVWHRAATETHPPAWLSERDAGHERAMRDAGLQPIPPITIACDFAATLDDVSRHLERDARLTAGYLVDRLGKGPIGGPVDALLAVSDGSVPTLHAACRLLAIPTGQIAIAGYDNYWQDCRERALEPAPPVMTVDKLNRDIGRVAVELLHDRLDGRSPPEPQRRVVSPQLIENPTTWAASPTGSFPQA